MQERRELYCKKMLGESFAVFPVQERRNGHLRFTASKKGRRSSEEKAKDRVG